MDHFAQNLILLTGAVKYINSCAGIIRIQPFGDSEKIMEPENMEYSADESGPNYLAGVLLFLEFYHFLAHTCVLFGIRLLPRKDLVRQRFYFLFDTMTVATTNFLYTGRLRWLAALQMCQHLFFVFTWNEHPYTKKVISWSSLDWLQSDKSKGWHWHLVLGTAFDTMVHAVNTYILTLYLSQRASLVAMFLSFTGILLLMLNSKFAWSSRGNVPKWVQKRVQPVDNREEDKYSRSMEVASVGLFFTGVGIICAYLS